MQVRLTRWGNSLGMRIPKEMTRRLGLSDGARVEVEADRGRIVISVARPRSVLSELVAGMTPAAVSDAFDWAMVSAGRLFKQSGRRRRCWRRSAASWPRYPGSGGPARGYFTSTW